MDETQKLYYNLFKVENNFDITRAVWKSCCVKYENTKALWIHPVSELCKTTEAFKLWNRDDICRNYWTSVSLAYFLTYRVINYIR